MNEIKRIKILVIFLLGAVAIFSIKNQHTLDLSFLGIDNNARPKVIDIENGINSVELKEANDGGVDVVVDYQYNGRNGFARISYYADHYPELENAGGFISVVVTKSGRDRAVLKLRRYEWVKTSYSLTNLKIQLIDSNNKVLAEKAVNEVISWAYKGVGKITKYDPKGIDSAYDTAVNLIDRATGISDLENAKIILDKIILEDSEYANAYVELARYHIKTNWNDNGLRSAERLINQALSINQDNANAHILLGYVYTHQKKYSQALKEFESAESIGTENSWLLTNWAELYVFLGQKEKAYEKFNKLVSTERLHRRNDRALVRGYKLYISYLRKNSDNSILERVLKTRADAFKENTCYLAEYAEYIAIVRNNYADAERLAKESINGYCNIPGYTQKTLAKVLLMKSFFYPYNDVAGSEKDYRRAQVLHDNIARLIADISEFVVTDDFYIKIRNKGIIDKTGSEGVSAIAYCVVEQSEKCVKELLKHGSNPNQIINNNGHSLLMVAVLTGNKDIVKKLINEGASVSYTTPDGVSASMLADVMGDKDMKEILRRKESI